jgi:hypothetical protein
MPEILRGLAVITPAMASRTTQATVEAATATLRTTRAAAEILRA